MRGVARFEPAPLAIDRRGQDLDSFKLNFESKPKISILKKKKINSATIGSSLATQRNKLFLCPRFDKKIRACLLTKTST